jgi:hypothetical protein
MKPTYREFYEAIYLLKREINSDKKEAEEVKKIAMDLLNYVNALAFSNKNYLEIAVNWVRNRTDDSFNFCLEKTSFNSENEQHILAKDFIKECFKNVR